MRILLSGHGFPPQALGGTEIYTHDLAHALKRRGEDVVVLAREGDPKREDYAVRRDVEDGIPVYRINYNFLDCRSFEGVYRNPRIRRIAGRLLADIQPEIVHFQHITCLSTDLVVECAQHGLPVFFTLNDYWLICQRGQLFDLDFQRCDGPHNGCTRCADAAFAPAALRAAPLWRRAAPWVPGPLATRARKLATNGAGDPAERERRTGHVRWMASHVNLFLAPSDTLRERFLDFGVPPEQIRRIEQGIEHDRLAAARAEARAQEDPKDKRPLKIGFLGSLIVSKAPHVLLEAFARLPEGAATLEVYGAPGPYHGDDSYGERLTALLAQPGIRHHGPVPHAQIPAALAALDVSVICSTWIENAPFVIREARVAGVPVIASDLGGMAEMVQHEQGGLLFPPGDAEALSQTLRRLVDEPDLLDRLRDGIPSTPTMDEVAEKLTALYRDPPAPPRALPRLAAVVLNYRTPRDTLLAVRSLRSSQRRVDEIYVVENGSEDGSMDYLRERLPEGVRLLESEQNLGFSGGCNLGIRAALDAGAERVFLLNCDAMVTPETLDLVEEALDTHPQAGLAGPLLLAAQDPSRIAGGGLSFRRWSGRMRQIDAGEPWDREAPAQIREVAAVSGCAVLIERAVFETAGLLDEDYFFSFEDLALGLMARKHGFRSVVATGALTYHQGSRSIGPTSPRRLYFAMRNHLLAAKRAARIPLILRPMRFKFIVLFNMAHALRVGGSRTANLAAVLHGIVDHLRGRYGAPER